MALSKKNTPQLGGWGKHEEKKWFSWEFWGEPAAPPMKTIAGSGGEREEDGERKSGREAKGFPRPTARWSRGGYLAACPLPAPRPAPCGARVGSPAGPPCAGPVGRGESGAVGLGAAVPGGAALGPVAGGKPVAEELFLPHDSQQSLL